MDEISSRHRITAYATGAFGLSANAIAYLLIPLRARELGVSIAVIGLLVGTKALVETVISVPLGGFMDRAGPRRALLIGTAGTAAVAIALVGTRWVAVLFLLQAVLGLFRTMGWIGGQSYVAGMRSGELKKYDTGRFGFAANLGQIVAPILAGAVAGLFGAAWGFTVLAAFALVVFGLSTTLPDLGRAPGTGDGGSSFGKAAGLLRLPKIRVVMLLTFSRLWIPAVWSSFFPLYLVSDGGVTPAVAGSAISAMAVAATATALFTGRIARLGGTAQVTAVGLVVSSVGVALSAVLGSVPWMYLAATLVGFGQGLSLPLLITLTSDAAPKEVRSLALGLRASVNQAAATAAPMTVGPLIAALGLFTGFPVAGAVSAGFAVWALAIAGGPEDVG